MADKSYIRTLINVLRNNSRYISLKYLTNKNSRCIVKFSNDSCFCFSIHQGISFNMINLTHYPYDRNLEIKPYGGSLLNKFKIESNSLILSKRTKGRMEKEEKVVMKDFYKYKREIKDLLNMVELLNINYGVFLHYMKEVYGEEKNYPLKLENVGINLHYSSLSWACIGRSLSFNVKIPDFGDNILIGPAGPMGCKAPIGPMGCKGAEGCKGPYGPIEETGFISPLYVENLVMKSDELFTVSPGNPIKGYTNFTKFSSSSEEYDHEYLFYQKGGVKVYVKLRDFEDGKDILINFSENISSYNESVEQYKDINEGYMDYIGKVMEKHLPNKNVKNARSAV